MSPADVLGLVGGVGGVIAALGGIIYAIKYVSASSSRQGELKAKDEVISTWEQASRANAERITILERDLGKAIIDLNKAHGQIRELSGKVETLKQFSAPEAIKRFETTQSSMVTVLNAISAKLDRITPQ